MSGQNEATVCTVVEPHYRSRLHGGTIEPAGTSESFDGMGGVSGTIELEETNR